MQKLANMPTTKQFAKFAVVGFASLAVDYALLLVLVEWLHIDLLFSTTVSFIASVIVNYVLSMRFVFEHKEDMSRKREFTIFAILSAIGQRPVHVRRRRCFQHWLSAHEACIHLLGNLVQLL